jgi:hypothetical protein
MLLMELREGLSSKAGEDAQTAVAEVKEHAGHGDRGEEAAAQFGTRIPEEVEEADPTLLGVLQGLRKLVLAVKVTVDTMWRVILTSGKQVLRTDWVRQLLERQRSAPSETPGLSTREAERYPVRNRQRWARSR